jgi:predicted SprT family Zn-dependent metalloprotease
MKGVRVTITDTRANITKQRRDAHGKLLPAVRDTPILPIVTALNDTLRSIRERNPELPNVVLVVGASGRKSVHTLALGHFAPKSWEQTAKHDKGETHEIAISGEVLQRGGEGVLEVMLHECAHLLAETREIKDTSRQGRFHNKKFKALAEEMGLVITESSKADGWNDTALTTETRTAYKGELSAMQKVLKLYRLSPKTEAAKPKTTVKIECECRSVTVPIKFIEKGELLCEECGTHFVRTDTEPENETDD